MDLARIAEQLKHPSKEGAEFDEWVREQVRKHGPLSSEELREQVLDYVWGMRAEGSTISRDEMAKRLFRY